MKMNDWGNWLPIFPNDERAKFDDDYVGFRKQNEAGYKMGGCYLYAYDPTGEIANEKPDHLDPRVVYIGTAGSSTSRGICSRTLDFSGTILRGHQQKNPYENGIYFRAKYGEENKRHLYVAYYPMGYGSKVKLLAHGKESQMLREYKDVYGDLPACDGFLGPALLSRELLKSLTVNEMKAHIDFAIKMLEYKQNAL